MTGCIETGWDSQFPLTVNIALNFKNKSQLDDAIKYLDQSTRPSYPFWIDELKIILENKQ